MKKTITILIPCAYSGCSDRRQHYESDKPRKHQMVKVILGFVGKAYCSHECQMYDESSKKINNKNKEMASLEK